MVQLTSYLQRVWPGEAALVCKHLGFAPGACPLTASLAWLGPLGGLALWGSLLLGCACMLGWWVCCIVLVSTCYISTRDGTCKSISM